MIQRFFLDGIDLQRGRRAVAQAVQLAALIDPNETESGLAWIDVAMPGTEIAMDAPAGFRFPPARLVQPLRFLENF